MKKLLAVVLSLITAFSVMSLAGWGGKDNKKVELIWATPWYESEESDLVQKVFNEELTPAEIIVFIRDYNVTESTNGTYINNATAGSVYRKIKEVLVLSKLYLTKKNIDNFFKNVDLNTSN